MLQAYIFQSCSQNFKSLIECSEKCIIGCDHLFRYLSQNNYTNKQQQKKKQQQQQNNSTTNNDKNNNNVSAF